MTTSDPAVRVRSAVDARMIKLGINQTDLVRSSGVSHPTIRQLQAKGIVPSRPKAAAIAVALGWEPDAFARIERGEEPTTAASSPAAARAQVEAAISADPNLTPEVRAALLATYRALAAQR